MHIPEKHRRRWCFWLLRLVSRTLEMVIRKMCITRSSKQGLHGERRDARGNYQQIDEPRKTKIERPSLQRWHVDEMRGLWIGGAWTRMRPERVPIGTHCVAGLGASGRLRWLHAAGSTPVRRVAGAFTVKRHHQVRVSVVSCRRGRRLDEEVSTAARAARAKRC